jgi:vacuolar protein sorting-associated protein 54
MANHSNRGHFRTSSASSSLSVVDLNDDEQSEWSYYSPSQSLPSVLNDPNLGRSVSEAIFTRDWGSYFTESFPIVRHAPDTNGGSLQQRDQFDGYLKSLRRRIRYQKMLLSQLDPLSSVRSSQNHARPTINGELSSKANRPSIQLDQFLPPLFLKGDFNLERPDIFVQLIAQNSDIELMLDKQLASKANNDAFTKAVKALESDLTDYLDKVEEQLAKQISARFRDFFHIMSAMDDVMDKLSKTIRQVSTVRQECGRLQQTLVYPSLKNIQLTKRRENLQMVYEKVRVMATVHETQPTIQCLLSSSDYVGALDLIATTQEVFNQDLVGLHSFRHLKSQLNEIRNVIDAMMQEDFVKFTTQEWNRPLTESEQAYKNGRIASNGCDSSAGDEPNRSNGDLLGERLSCMILGMLRVQRLNFIQVFKDEACTTIKTVVKQTLIETLAREDTCDAASPFEQINELNFGKWKRLLNQLFDNLFVILKRIECIHRVIVRTIETVTVDRIEPDLKRTNLMLEASIDAYESSGQTSTNNQFLTGEEADKLESQLKQCFDYICDFSHSQCAEILDTRAKEHSFSKISFADFVDLVKTIERFAVQCEQIFDRRPASLKLVLQAQTNNFVSRFHDERKKKLMVLLDIEQWKSCDQVSVEFQQMITDLIEYNRSVDELTNYRKADAISDRTSVAKPLPYLDVNSQKFVVVSSVITLINMIFEYCKCATEIPALSADLLTRLLDLLRQFNARVSQLVLCAGATQVAGLKTITSRNLLVSSRCLTLILVLLPYLKTHFGQILPEKHRHMLKHFDETKRLYIEHVQKVNDKVISVVKELFSVNLNKWEAKPPVPSSQFKEISQHLQRLYLNIEDTLPEEELNQLFFEIHHVFKHHLRKQLGKLKIVNDGGPQHG